MRQTETGNATWPRRRWQSPEDRLVLAVEIFVVIMIGVVPFLAGSILDVSDEATATAAPNWGRGEYLYDLVTQIATTVPVLFIMWRTGRAWAYFGITRLHAGADLLLGIGVCGVTYAAYWVAWWAQTLLTSVAPAAGRAMEIVAATPDEYLWPAPQSAEGWVWVVVTELGNAISEEVVVKAYLLPRLHELLGNTTAAVTIAASLFASYHLYQGSSAVVAHVLVEMVMGFWFLKFRRLWPFVLGHAMYNLTTYVGA